MDFALIPVDELSVVPNLIGLTFKRHALTPVVVGLNGHLASSVRQL
jgi:hypothetical protein